MAEWIRDCGDSASNQSLLRAVLRARFGAALAGSQRPLRGAFEPHEKSLVSQWAPDAFGRAQAGQRGGIRRFVEGVPERGEPFGNTVTVH